MKITIMLFQLLLCLASIAPPNTAKFVGNVNDDDGGTITILDIQDDNKTQYLNQNFEQGNYNYGYDIKPSGPVGQFHHENKSPQDVVYGCYGFEGPDNKNYMTFYVSDAWGFRPVRQEQDIEIFYPADNPAGTGHHNGKMTRWADLVFPDMCAHFAERIASSTNVVTKTPQQLASPPPSIVTKLQSAVTPVTPFPGLSQTSSLTTSSVPSSSFDVIQFNTPSGSSGNPFSRLTSAGPEETSRLPDTALNRETQPSQSQQPQNTHSVFDKVTNNRFSTVTTTTTTAEPSAIRNSGIVSTSSPVVSNTQFSNNGPITPGTGVPPRFSRPIPNNPSGTSSQPTQTRGKSTLAGPTGSSNRNTAFTQFPNTVPPNGPVGQSGATPANSVLPSFSRKPSDSSDTETFIPSTPVSSNTRFSTDNRQQTPQVERNPNSRITTTTSSLTSPGQSTSIGRHSEASRSTGNTNFRGTTGPAGSPTTGLGQTTRSQGSTSFGGSTNFKSTSRPQEAPTGSGQTTNTVRPHGSTSFGGTGTSNFRSTLRPQTHETSNNIPTGPEQFATGTERPSASTPFAGTGTSNFRTSRPLGPAASIPSTGPGRQTTGITRQPQTPPLLTGSSNLSRTTAQGSNQVGTGQTQAIPTSAGRNPTPFTNSRDHSFESSRTTSSGPARNPYNNGPSDEDDNNVNTVPHRNVNPTGSSQGGFATSPYTSSPPNTIGSGSRAPPTTSIPNSIAAGRGTGATDIAGVTGSTLSGNSRANANIPSTTSPFSRPGFVNNPSTLQPSSTNRNAIPTTNRRPSVTDSTKSTDRFTHGTGTPAVPQEPDEDTLVSTRQPSFGSGSTIGNTPTPFNQGITTQSDRQTTSSKPTTTQPAFGARRPTATTHSAPTSRLPAISPLKNTTSAGNRNQEESFCETQCSSCKTNSNTVRDEDFSQIPGAILANIPVIFYPDCSGNAYSRPAIVPFCPSQKSQCGETLSMKFPDANNFIVGNAPVARNAFVFDESSRTSRKVRRGRQPRSI